MATGLFARVTTRTALAVVILGLASPGARGGPLAATPLRLVYAQPSAAFTPLFVAQDEGLFAKEGLDVGLTQVTGSAAVATLLSGESQVMSAGATEVSGIDVAGGDVVMLAAGSNLPVFSLYVSPSIHAVQDLVGKKIAVTTIGTSTDTTARLILEHFGLTGKVEIIGTGGNITGVLAAIQAGIASGGILSAPTTVKAEELGLHELVNGVRLGLPMTQTAVAVRRSYLSQHRDIMLHFMRAYLAAWAFVRNPANEDATERAIAHYTRTTQGEAAAAYKAFTPIWRQVQVPRVIPIGVLNVLRFSENARVRGMNPISLIDGSLLDELVRSGYVDSLYR